MASSNSDSMDLSSNAEKHSEESTSSAASESVAKNTSSGACKINTNRKQPICVLMIGMAGSGKTTAVSALQRYFLARKNKVQVINLDPGVKTIPYVPFIDIRDTVDYAKVMEKHELGPNGGIVTSLNLFASMFDDVIKLIEKYEDETEFVIIDTPGQIEVFNWSASGPLITGLLASTYPTIIAYVVDTPRSNSTQTFMSNMLYATSILYKYKLPLLIAFNKTDITDCQFAIDWMREFDTFQDVVSEENEFSSNLTRSINLALEEFYRNINACGISAHSGEGFPELERLIRIAAVEYEDYREELKKDRELKMKKDKIDAQDKSGFVNLRKNIASQEEVSVGPNSDESEEEVELDHEDTEEKSSGKSFSTFLKKCKK